MRVLVNATTLHSGGGLQVALSLIGHMLRDRRAIDWRFAVSRPVAHELAALGLPLPADALVCGSPTRNRSARRQLRAHAEDASADAVFTVFGPAYVRFASPHLMGVADGWTTHPSQLAYRSLRGPIERLRFAARGRFKGRWYRQADAWIAEAECAAAGLSRRFGVPRSRVAVIPNACGQGFRSAAAPMSHPVGATEIRVLSIAHPYPHKNLSIIPQVAAAARRLAPDRRLRFVLTVPQDTTDWHNLRRQSERLRVADCIESVGRVAVADVIDLYRSTHVALVPTLLETSTAAYPEAMAMGLPIVTPDLDFARDACGSAAAYYPPTDSEAAAKLLLRVVESPSLWEELTDAGRERVHAMPDDTSRYERTIETLRQLVGNPSSSSSRHTRRAA
ncbi:MAG: glycosyltransferase [Planctomycetota bacterium]